MSSPEQFYNTHGAGNDRGFDGARTEWAGMGIDEVLDVLSSMNPGVADGDVNTILQAIEAVRRAAEAMHGMFGDQMSGQASDAALEAGRSLSADMATTSASAGQIGDAMSGAAGILESTRGQEGRLRELQQHLRDNPEQAASVRHEVDRTMTGTYSSPMIGVQYTLPREPVNANGMTSGLGTGDVTRSAAGGTGSETARGQAANTVDAGDFGPSGTRATPTGVPAAGPGPAGGGPGATAAPAAASGPSAGSAPRAGGDGPDGLLRGGRGSPEAVTRGASSVPGSQHPTPHPAGSASGAASGLPGGSSGPIAPLAMAAPAPGPSSAAPPSAPVTSPPSVSTPSASTPPGAVAQRPGGIGSPGPLGVPPGSRRPGGDDETHRAAPYLNTREHGAEIVGDMPLVGPPVIGDWVRPTFPSTPEPAPGPAPESTDASPSRDAGGDHPASSTTTDVEAPAPAKPGGT
ncbi:hypothetical protein [Gordonia sp. 'Campus']|uniref:hypothetical protein n=1 Tax=Gordonia sp. 'Campus' TaxID=2915824 RepID=UPI001EE4B959|nr:hypothetical protein [Gordonia sp. 'Campus']